MNFLDTLNGKNIFTEYHLVIQTGTQELLEFPGRKESLTNDWREENGTETDLQTVRFKDKQASLTCLFLCDNDQQFWTAYNAFFAELTKPGLQDLFIYDHSKTYKAFYQSTSGFKKMNKRLKSENKVGVKFTLVLQIKTV